MAWLCICGCAQVILGLEAACARHACSWMNVAVRGCSHVCGCAEVDVAFCGLRVSHRQNDFCKAIQVAAGRAGGVGSSLLVCMAAMLFHTGGPAFDSTNELDNVRKSF